VICFGCRVTQRNEARKNKAAERSKAADKIGYVPRNKQTTASASGLSSAGMVRGKDARDQQLDAESAAGLAKLKESDAEIDAGIDAISRTIDNLNNIAGQMKDEVGIFCSVGVVIVEQHLTHRNLVILFIISLLCRH
jgi:hypothetical protein